MTATVVMFAKAPVPGEVKTRLAEAIGAERAAAFHAAFIADLAGLVGGLDVRRVLAWAGDAGHPGFDPARSAAFEFVPQPAGNLGQRLDAVIREQATRAEHVVVIGSDSPTLQATHFRDALARLVDHDVVIGPSFDGGYYLIGVRSDWYLQSAPAVGTHPLFTDIDWSTSRVLDQTLSRCEDARALCDLIAFCYDVDTLDDLSLLRTHLLRHMRPSGLDVAPNTAILLSETLTS